MLSLWSLNNIKHIPGTLLKHPPMSTVLPILINQLVIPKKRGETHLYLSLSELKCAHSVQPKNCSKLPFKFHQSPQPQQESNEDETHSQESCWVRADVFSTGSPPRPAAGSQADLPLGVHICSRIKMRWKQTLRTDSGSELLEGIFTSAGWITETGAAVHHRDTVSIKGSFMLWTQMASMSVPADHKIFTSQTAFCALFLPVLLPAVEPGSMRVTTQWPVNHHSLKKCRMCVYKTNPNPNPNPNCCAYKELPGWFAVVGLSINTN